MKKKVVLAPYGVQVLVYEQIDEDGRVLWFTDEQIEAAAKMARTHKEDAEPEPLSAYIFKERY